MALLVLFGGMATANAQTTGASAQTEIDALRVQIAMLQTRFDALVKAQADARAAAAEVTETVKLLRQMREGMTGADITALQAILAKYPDLYPEGMVTGFYGKATARAVKRFQNRHGIRGEGAVGERTLEKLKKELEDNPVAEEKEEGTGRKKLCAAVPPGHLIAPGWLRKQGGRPIVPPCQKLPPGIERLLERRTTTTTPPGADITPPVISGVSATSTASTTARILWTTNEQSDSAVWYATSSPVLSNPNMLVVRSSSLVTSHDMLVSGLSASTTYYYLVVSADAAHNAATSSEFAVTTLQ